MVKCFFLHKMKLYFSMFILLLLKKKIGQISCICMQCLYVGTSEYLLLLACLYQILGLLRMSAQTVLIRPNSTTALYSTKTQLMIYQFSSFIRLSLTSHTLIYCIAASFRWVQIFAILQTNLLPQINELLTTTLCFML